MLLLKDEDVQRVLTISMTLGALEATQREKPGGLLIIRPEAVCAVAYHAAMKRGIGREIPTEWFTQSIRD